MEVHTHNAYKRARTQTNHKMRRQYLKPSTASETLDNATNQSRADHNTRQIVGAALRILLFNVPPLQSSLLHVYTYSKHVYTYTSYVIDRTGDEG
jgi:hypothetical protein